MNKPQILKCCAREILDSRGNPTVEASVFLTDGTVGMASVPSGASTGIYEAHEKRDGDEKRYGGKGVTEAVRSICRIISPAITGISATEQTELDKVLLRLDGSENKSKLGANALLAVSLASARAAANWYHVPLFRYLGGVDAYRLPVPMMNILNGGAHASNNVEIQEFMIVPTGLPRFSDALRAGSEIYHALGRLLKERGFSAAVGDEGGFAPDLQTDEQAIDLIREAITAAGYSTDEVKIALDAAASEWYDEGNYRLPKRQVTYSRQELIDYWESLCNKYPMILSVEDALDQRDMEGWQELTRRLGKRIMLVGDDFFVTNTQRLHQGIEKGAANAILIKPNQIGTLTETMEVIHLAKDAGYRFILSHRSGETEDTTIADIAVALNAPFIKTGAPCRSERVSKYNRLLRIESALNSGAQFGFAHMPEATPDRVWHI
ncbi:MAG: phosphopyruvate hydratase [Clostridia bacterium]|nr:phosphopyruvate hydratase [Clostridia bacterium]MBQ8331909.1 phosphopyruvate hydratase [Clostridia bacterium]